jgi:hypothetical protein
MPKGAAWESAEIAAVAKAYVDATNNPLRDVDQKQKVFIADLLSKLKSLAPVALNPKLGTYHHRGAATWTFLSGACFKDVQKFVNVLRNVYLSEPSGFTEQQEINMAVAIHMKKNQSNESGVQELRCYQRVATLSRLAPAEGPSEI